MVEFDDNNEPIVFQPTGNIEKKVAFLDNLFNRASEKVNHFDKLRQQNLNYALLAFSGLVAFILQTSDWLMPSIACVGIIVTMDIFRWLDDRFHRFTHGFVGSTRIFAKVTAYLLDNPNEDVRFHHYYTPAESRAGRAGRSMQEKIYVWLAIGGFILEWIILLKGPLYMLTFGLT